MKGTVERRAGRESGVRGADTSLGAGPQGVAPQRAARQGAAREGAAREGAAREGAARQRAAPQGVARQEREAAPAERPPLWVEEPARRRRLPDPVRTAAVRAVIIVAVTLVQAMVAFLT